MHCVDYRLEEEGLDETLPFIILLVLLATTNSVHNLNLLLVSCLAETL